MEAKLFRGTLRNALAEIDTLSRIVAVGHRTVIEAVKGTVAALPIRPHLIRASNGLEIDPNKRTAMVPSRTTFSLLHPNAKNATMTMIARVGQAAHHQTPQEILLTLAAVVAAVAAVVAEMSILIQEALITKAVAEVILLHLVDTKSDQCLKLSFINYP